MGMLNFRRGPTTSAPTRTSRSAPRQGVAERGSGIQHDPGHEAPVAGVRPDGLARWARGVDRREVAALVGLRRRRAAALHPRRAAHHDRHLLVHRDHQQRQPPATTRAGATRSGSPRASGCSRPRVSCWSARSAAPPPTSGRRRGPGPKRSTTCSGGRCPTGGSTSRRPRPPTSTSRSCGRSSVISGDPAALHLTRCQNGAMTTATIDLLDLDRFQRLEHHEMFERLRAEDPVSWHEYPGEPGLLERRAATRTSSPSTATPSCSPPRRAACIDHEPRGAGRPRHPAA